MRVSPRLFCAYELPGLSSTAFWNDSSAALRLPACSWARPSVFQAAERFGEWSTAILASLRPRSVLPRASSLRAAASASAGLPLSLSSATIVSVFLVPTSILAAGGGSGSGVAVGIGVGAGGSTVTTGFVFGGGGTLSSHAARLLARVK